MWRLSNESFIRQYKWIDNLALRLSYGLQGNIDKGTSPFLVGKYDNVNILPGYSEENIIINSAPNSKLRWEKTASYNLGMDFSVLNQAINLSVDYYYRKGTDSVSYTHLDVYKRQLLGRDLLVVNKLQRVPAELNDAGVNRGVNYENQMVCMEWDKATGKLMLRQQRPLPLAPQTDAIFRSVKDNFISPLVFHRKPELFSFL